jgi:hypothetical protein
VLFVGREKEKEDFAEFGEYYPQVSATGNLRLEITFLQSSSDPGNENV